MRKRKKNKEQRGFIRIPLAAMVVVFIVVASGGTAVVLYQQNKLAYWPDRSITEPYNSLAQGEDSSEKTSSLLGEENQEEALISEVLGEAEIEVDKDERGKSSEEMVGEIQPRQELEAQRLVEEKRRQELETQRLAEEKRQEELKKQQELEAQKLAEEQKRQQDAALRTEICKTKYIIQKEKKTTELLLELIKTRAMWENVVMAEYNSCVNLSIEQIQEITGIDFSDLPGEGVGGTMSMIRAQCEKEGKVDELVDQMKKLRQAEIEEELQLEYLQCLLSD